MNFHQAEFDGLVVCTSSNFGLTLVGRFYIRSKCRLIYESLGRFRKGREARSVDDSEQNNAKFPCTKRARGGVSCESSAPTLSELLEIRIGYPDHSSCNADYRGLFGLSPSFPHHPAIAFAV
jgi:hypothetical protein